MKKPKPPAAPDDVRQARRLKARQQWHGKERQKRIKAWEHSPPRICPGCTTSFKPAFGERRIYCEPVCQQMHQQRQHIKAQQQRLAARHKDNPPRRCLSCEWPIPFDPLGRRRYCSPQCKAKARLSPPAGTNKPPTPSN